MSCVRIEKRRVALKPIVERWLSSPENVHSWKIEDLVFNLKVFYYTPPTYRSSYTKQQLLGKPEGLLLLAAQNFGKRIRTQHKSQVPVKRSRESLSECVSSASESETDDSCLLLGRGVNKIVCSGPDVACSEMSKDELLECIAKLQGDLVRARQYSHQLELDIRMMQSNMIANMAVST